MIDLECSPEIKRLPRIIVSSRLPIQALSTLRDYNLSTKTPTDAHFAMIYSLNKANVMNNLSDHG